MKLKVPMIAAGLLPLSVFAQTSSPALETILVTGSFAPQAVTTASVSVLDRDTISAFNKRNVADLLKTLPGLLVEEAGGPGALTAVSIRGGEANFTLVLLDGVALNDPSNSRGGGFDFSNLDPSLVERIEVFRGPQSAVYGSDALAGVINIITRRVEDGHQQNVRAQWGADGYRDMSFVASGATEDVRYTLNLSKRDTGEPVAGSERETDHVNLHVDWTPTSKQMLSASYRYLDGNRTSYPEQSGGPDYALSDDLDQGDFTDKTAALAWEAEFASYWRSTIRGSRFEHSEAYSSPGIPPFSAVPPNAAISKFRRDLVQWVNTLTSVPDVQLNLGADRRDEKGSSVGYLDLGFSQLPTDFSLDRVTRGVFSDISWQPSEALLLQAALRYDDPEQFKDETSLRLGVSYDLSSTWKVSANWGEAYKLPSFFALGHALVGNPDLLPETAASWDASMLFAPQSDLTLEMTYFSNDYSNLIDFDAELFTNVNRKKVESRGGEFQLQWLPIAPLTIGARATYTDLEVKGEDSVLFGRPRWLAGANAHWRVAAQWSTMLDYQWTGEQTASSLHTGQSLVYELKDYHRIDWAVRWSPRPALRFDLSLDNILDERYQVAVGFEAPGRALRLAVTVTNY